MSFVPYSRQTISDDDITAVINVLRSEFLTQGPAVEDFERAFAQKHQTQHAVAVSNATAGLHIACLALDIAPGKLVWTSPNSFLASANCALYCGASVDFVDIDPVTKNISLVALEEKLRAAEAAGKLPDLLIPVDFAGLPADLREMRGLADQYGFKILEDASHAIGASYLGAPVGSQWADASVFSLHAVKIVTSGEGGVVTTQDPKLAARLRRLRSHGITRNKSEFAGKDDGPWYYQQMDLGFNYRLTDFQAALAASQLGRLSQLHEARMACVERYSALLETLPLKIPVHFKDRVSAWHLYVIEVDGPDAEKKRLKIFNAMRDSHIGVNVHYIPIHTQPFYQRLGFRRGQFPNAEMYYSRAISLPLFPELTFEVQSGVVEKLKMALLA